MNLATLCSTLEEHNKLGTHKVIDKIKFVEVLDYGS